MSDYAWPVPGYKMTTPYGKKGSYWRACGFHTGIDIAAPTGTEIVAPEDGDIRVRAYGSAFGGKQFALSPDHPGEWFFAHVSWRVPANTRVKKGQVIARVGAEGNVSGPHLHLEYHPQKMLWGCGNMKDPMDLLGAPSTPQQGSGGGWMFPAGHKVYQKFLRVDGHEQNKDRNSDSIKALQEVLNKHSMPGGSELPITGKYWSGTDKEVRLCQELHLPPVDPQMKSFVGPSQWEHLVKATGCPYVWVPGDNAVPVSPQDPPNQEAPAATDSQWFVPPSIKKLLSEVNERWPDRSKTSDGTIGDYAHSQSKSEHNPVGHVHGPVFGTPGAVHAVDITADNLDLVQSVIKATVADDRVWYVIHAGKILSRTYGWANNDYKGSNPHNTHIHISLREDSKEVALKAENDTSPWIDPVLPAPDPEPAPAPAGLTADQKETLRKAVELLQGLL